MLAHDSSRRVSRSVFLLSRSHRLPLTDAEGDYDEREQLNMLRNCGPLRPIVAAGAFGWTESKTERAPGDDDPDPEDEGCY